MEIKSYFKVSLKWRDGKPSIKEVSYQGADWETYNGLQFEWYASTKDMDRTNDVVVPWAFQKSLNQYMENPIIFLQHNNTLPIGNVIEASIDDSWLFVKGIVKADKENIFQDLRTGVIKTMSFWYRVTVHEQKEKKEWNKTIYYNEIQELELFEISLVSVPMNPKAKIKSKEELLGKNLSDKEYAKYFQINKDEEYTLFKSISDVMLKFKNNVIEDTKQATLNSKWKANAKTHINAGDYDATSDWSFSADDWNKLLWDNGDDWANYAKWFLWINSSQPDDTKAHYKYPFGKNDKVYRSWLTAISQRAWQQHETEIMDTAQALVDMIDKKEENKSIDIEIKTFDDLKKKSIWDMCWMKTMQFDYEIKKIDIPNLYKDKIPLGAIYFEWVVSDETVNRYWEKVLNSAFKWQINKFIKNWVILNWHNSDEPIGIPLRVKISGWQVQVWGYVFDEYTDNRVSKWLYRGLSIWFMPTEWVWEDKETEEQITDKEFKKLISEIETFKEFLALLDKYMFVITKLDWLEYSFVTTPANKWTTIKLDYIEWKNEFIDKLRANPLLLNIKDVDMEMKPYENEHSCRLRDPADFEDWSFKRIKRKSDDKEYSVIMWKLKWEDTMTEQAYRYNKDVWTETEAKNHCKDHDWSFEAATWKECIPCKKKKEDKTPIETVDKVEDKPEKIIDGAKPNEEEKMQIEPIVEIEKPKEETPEVEEEKPAEIPTADVTEVVDEVDKEKEEEPKKEEEQPKETIETPEIPENNGWDAIDTEIPKETPAENAEQPKETVSEERVDEIEKNFTKSIDEISNRFKNVEWLTPLVKEMKGVMETSIKELKSEQDKFKNEVWQVVSWCVDVVNVLAKNFKNFCINGGLQFTEHTETKQEKKEKQLLETPLAKTLERIKTN